MTAQSRRDFLRRAGGAGVLQALTRRSPGRPGALVTSPRTIREPFPGVPLVARFLAAAGEGIGGGEATGLTRADYLRLIDGIVGFFEAHQDSRGAIIDPYERKERQYSTPAFALAAAALCVSGRRPAVLPAALKAMSSACADLADGRAADRHPDFFTVLLVHADVLLRRLAPPATAAAWQADLARVVPEQIYVNQPGSGAAPHNWNLVAAAGEGLRAREGYGRSQAWVDASVALQLEWFTPAGMYRDPNDPLAYDHFARLWALDLLQEGCAGRHEARLSDLLERGAWASLFMQSPHGELPCGGRSAHHQWNEAEQAVTFETFARRFHERGDTAAAAAFKRGARRALGSIARWVRPSGELWIVKNRLDPRLRHGYESYSFHSQYNLLTAAMLALAWLRADDQIGEGLVPTEAAGFAFGVQPGFHKVFAAAAGYHVEIETSADLHYNPTGLFRVHHRGFPPEILSDGVTTECAYHVPTRPTRTLALGPEWQDAGGQWVGLAAASGTDLEPADVRVEIQPEGSVVELRYRGRLPGGATSVRQKVRVSREGVETEHAVEGPVRAVRGVVPILVSDGETETAMRLDGAVAEVTRGGRRVQLTGRQAAAWSRAGVREPGRNGFLEALHLEGEGSVVRFRIAGRP